LLINNQHLGCDVAGQLYKQDDL